jgi:hypothetical protein
MVVLLIFDIKFWVVLCTDKDRKKKIPFSGAKFFVEIIVVVENVLASLSTIFIEPKSTSSLSLKKLHL